MSQIYQIAAFMNCTLNLPSYYAEQDHYNYSNQNVEYYDSVHCVQTHFNTDQMIYYFVLFFFIKYIMYIAVSHCHNREQPIRG